MQVVVVGGLDRQPRWLRDCAERYAVRLHVHDGYLHGRGSVALRSAIERADLVVVQTELNSHGAVWLAKKLCRRFDRSLLLVRRLDERTCTRLFAEPSATAPARSSP